MTKENDTINLKPQQAPLLRVEKHLAGLGAFLALAPSLVKAAEDKLQANIVTPEEVALLQADLLDVAVRLGDIHLAFETKANEVGADFITSAFAHYASGGDSKPPHVAQVIKSFMGIS